MKEILVFRSCIFAAALAFVGCVAAHAKVNGDYVETRNADVYTGQCFANSEVGLSGDQAILAWHIRSGSWGGVKLDGFSVVAVVKANATLGDPYADPYPAKSVLIIDQRANAHEREALAAFAKQMGGKLLANVMTVLSAQVEVQVEAEHHGSAFLKAGDFLTVQTRSINNNDHLCGNESTFYQPLARVSHAMPAVATTDSYNGGSLGRTWTLHDKRSAFVGTF
jgi:hypothetical protein